jgi:hypothetical protein
VVIEWPGGGQTEVIDVAANQVLDVVVETDTDGDGTPDLSDLDDDDDGVDDTADCFPSGADFWQAPGPAGALSLAHGAGVTTLTWSGPADPGGNVVLYDLLEAPSPQGFEQDASCVETNDFTDTSATHDQTPPPGQVLHFLVRAENGCGTSSVGTDSLGADRVARFCG